MESRYMGESRSYGESREHTYREPIIRTGESRRISSGESRRNVSQGVGESFSTPAPGQSRLAELRAQLVDLKQAIAREKERQEEEQLLSQIREAQEELDNLRNNGQHRRR